MQDKDVLKSVSAQEILNNSENKVTIGSGLYESIIFCGNPSEFKLQKRKSVCSPQYVETFALRKTTKKALANALTEYNRILHGKEPEHLDQIRQLQHSIKSFTQKISAQRKKIEKAEQQAREKIATLKNNSGSEKKKSKIYRDFECFKENARQTISQLRDSRREAKEELLALQNEQAELLVQKSEDISLLKEAILKYDKMLADMLSDKLSQYIVQRDAIIRLVQNDLDLSSDTQRKIISLAPDYAKSEWHLSLKPLGTSFSLISMEIKQNINQTMAELIASVAESRGISFVDAMVVLSALKKRGMLFYMEQCSSDHSLELQRWTPTLAKKKMNSINNNVYCHDSGERRSVSAAKA